MHQKWTHLHKKSWLTLFLWSSLLFLCVECLTPAASFQPRLYIIVISLWLLSNQRTPLSLAFLPMSLQRRAEAALATASGVHFIKWCDTAGADKIYLNSHHNSKEQVVRPPNHVLSSSPPILTFISFDWLFSKTLSLRETAGNTPLKIRRKSLILPLQMAFDLCQVLCWRTFSES